MNRNKILSIEMVTYKHMSIILTSVLMSALKTHGLPVTNPIDPSFTPSHQNGNDAPTCREVFSKGEYILMEHEVFIPSLNETVPNTEVRTDGATLCLLEDTAKGAHKLDCLTWRYDADEFQVLDNGSVVLNDEILQPNTYIVNGTELETCAEGDQEAIREEQESINISHYIGTVTSSISVSCLILHLFVFAMLPNLRNIPGYNLASMSLAFLLAYTFTLIGQIPEVLGTACVVSAYLEHYFFLSAFFWMNAMAFDVWRVLRMTVNHLVYCNNTFKSKKFLYYCVYAWCCPLAVSIIMAVVGSTANVSYHFKTGFGNDETCWFTNSVSKTVFFVAPAFTIFIANAIFFAMSAYMIVNNTMADQNCATPKRDYVLYLKLGSLVGLTWSIAILASIVQELVDNHLLVNVLWYFFEGFNGLQGLFVFVLFTCSKKNWVGLKEKFFQQGKQTSFNMGHSNSTTKTDSSKGQSEF